MKVYRSRQACLRIRDTYDKLLKEWGCEVKERDISVSYGTTHVIEWGDENSAPLVLFHGVGDDSALMWIYNAEYLGRYFHVYAIAAIDSLVEQTKKSHVWEGEAVPTERTLEYYVDGKQRIVEISGEQLSTYHPDSEPHPEICWVVTVDGESYALCEFTPDEPYYQLYYSTQKGGNLTFRKQNNKNNDSNNEDEFYDDPFDEEYHNEEAARKLKSIIDDIRKNSTPQYETENLYYYYEEHLPSGDDCRADCSFKLDGNYYDIELYWDSDLIRLDVCEWRDGKDLTLLYKDTQNWIAEFDEVFGTLTDVPDEFGAQPEDTEELEWFGEDDTAFGEQEDELSDDMVKIPELFELTEEQAVAALKEAGLNCLIRYDFNSTEKGYVSSYYGDPNTDNYVNKGTYIAVDISLGEYDGPIEMVKPEFATWYYPTKESKLKVPVPDGLSGSYTFNIYFGTDPEYTTTTDDIKGVKNITLDVYASDKERFVVYAKKNNSAEKKLIRYATYEFDYTAETWTLIGKLNTDGLLGAK